MSKISKTLNTLIVVLILALVTGTANAQNIGDKFKDGKLFFRITSLSPKKVHVTSPNETDPYWQGHQQPTGDITIPTTANNNGSTYQVMGIDDAAFSDCDKITAVQINKNITYIGYTSFWWNDKQQSINVSSDNPNYSSLNGILFDKAQDTLILMTKGYKTTNYSVPNGVKVLRIWCFQSNSLNRINLPSSVKEIGLNAFSKPNYLHTIFIDNNNQYFSSDANGVLYNKNKTELIKIPRNYKKTTHYEIPSTVNTLTAYSGFAIQILKSLTIPASVTQINNKALWYAELGILKVKNTDPTNINLGENVFLKMKKNICILIVPDGTKSLYEKAPQWEDFPNIIEESEYVKLTNLELQPAQKELDINQTFQLNPIYTPNYASQKNILWKSYNNNIATVDQNGLVTAKGVGSTTIKATSYGTDGLIATCQIVVKPKEITVQLQGTVSKEYDGNKEVNNLTTDNYKFVGAEAEAKLSLANSSKGTYSTKTVGTNKTVTVTDLVLQGEDATQYKLKSNTVSGDIGIITAKEVTASLKSTITKEYDGNATANNLTIDNYKLTGAISGDNVSLKTKATGTYNDKNVETNNKKVSVTGLSLQGDDKGNYKLKNRDISGVIGIITPKEVTASLQNTVEKVYDGTKTANLKAENYKLNDVIAGDNISLNPPTTSTYNNKNAGANKPVKAKGFTLTGDDKNNYTLASADVSGNIGTITKMNITVTADEKSKVKSDPDPDLTYKVEPALLTGDNFEGELKREAGTAVGEYNILQGTLSAGDNYNITFVGAKFKIIDNTIYVKGVSLNETSKTLIVGNTFKLSPIFDPTDATNQNVTWNSSKQTIAKVDNNGLVTALSVGKTTITVTTEDGNFTATCDITVETIPVTVTLQGNITKVYDRTNTADLKPENYLVEGLKTSDDVKFNYPTSGTYDDKTANTSKKVTVTGLTLTGTDANKYSLKATEISGNIGEITAKEVVVNLQNTVEKVYDGTNTANLTADNYHTADIISGDNVELGNPATITYNDKTVGDNKMVEVTGLTLIGTDANNYHLKSGDLSKDCGKITQRPLTVSLQNKVSKTYDQNTDAQINADNYKLEGKVESDNLYLDNPPTTGTYADANVGNNIEVSVIGLAITGDDASNYNLQNTSATGNVGEITPLALTVNLIGSVSKEYDGTTEANLTDDNYELIGVLTNDDVVLNNPSKGEFNSKDVDAVTVTVNGLAISGTKSSNYSLASNTVSNDIGTISAKEIKVTADDKSKKKGDTDPELTYTVDPALISGDKFTGNLKREEGEEVKDYKILQGSLSAGVNYNITFVEGVFKITDNKIAVTDVALNETNINVTIGNTAQLSPVFEPSNATNQNVSWSSDAENIATVDNNGLVTAKSAGAATITVTTEDGGHTATCKVTVNKISLSVSLQNTVEKVYDGTDDAILTIDNYIFGNEILSGDDVKLSNFESGKYADKNVGRNKMVTVTGLTLAGTDANKYALATTEVNSTIGEITIKKIKVTPDENQSKVVGADDPIFTYTPDPELFLGDPFTGKLSRVEGEDVGEYEILKGNLSAGTNYEITFVSGVQFEIVTNAIAVTGVSLDQTTKELEIGGTFTLKATISPEDATNKTVTWTSSDNTIAKVDENGQVTAVAEGQATITVTTDDGNFTATCEVTVIATTIAVTGVSLDPTEKSLAIGEEFTLTATVEPADATNQTVTWTNSDNTVATLEDGKVTALKEGTTTITVTTNDGNFTATCEVTVTSTTIAVTGVSLDPTEKSLTIGEEFTLTATVEPADATNQTVTWTNSDNTVATLEDGKVTALKEGTAIITVTTDDGNFTATCEVTVTTSTGIDNKDNVIIKLYPTIVEKGFTIETNGNLQNVELYSVTGGKIQTIKISNKKQFIDISNLQSGVYIAKLGTKTIKIVKK